MGSTVKAFNYRDLTQHAKAELGSITINVKALPLTAGSQNLFTITGSISVHSLLGIVTVAASAAISPTLGFTPASAVGGGAAVIAAAPAAGFTGAAGNVIQLPSALGGQMPAPVAATTATAKAAYWAAQNGIITVTTNVTLTAGTIAWVLVWAPLYPKNEVATVVND